MNGTKGDAIVKLKDAHTNHTIVSAFVTENASVELTEIPDGEYRVQFAFGNVLDESCQNFLGLDRGKEFPQHEVLHARITGNKVITSSLEYTLYAVPSGNVQPFSISAAEFNAD